ncbi:hypothetical protein GF369_03055 [Candidatus Peregrinibacteria bacterium]|nr:hypothetical protein [Candidatus Peregrinibacteria bacterium]
MFPFCFIICGSVLFQIIT